ARGLVLPIVDTDAVARAALNEHLVACTDQLAYTGGHQPDPILMNLDLFWHPHAHDVSWYWICRRRAPAAGPRCSGSSQLRVTGPAWPCVMHTNGLRCGRICGQRGFSRRISAPMELDRYDRAILRLLQQDARITNTALAEKVNLSESACLRRVRALEESGLIQGYTALIDQQKAGYPVNVFVSITLDRQSQSGLEAFENAVRKVPEVMECYLMTGEHDYLLRLVVADLADFERIHNQHLTRLPSVASVQSSFAMRTVTRARALPMK